MTEARKNGTKPKISPFRLSVKPNIKDAPIFDDVVPAKKKKRLVILNSSKHGNNEGIAFIKEDIKSTPGQIQKAHSPFGKATASLVRKSPRIFRRTSDPYKADDPFEIMTAEPEEDEPVEDVSVEPENKEIVKDFRVVTVEADEKDVNKAETEVRKEVVMEDDEENGKEGGNEKEKGLVIETEKKFEMEGRKEDVKELEEFEKELSEHDKVTEVREEDILEINVDVDNSAWKDMDDNNFDEELKKHEDGKAGRNEEKLREKRHKKHKKSEKHEKGEKKKKRKKERNKSEDESHEKRHKRRRRDERSRTRSRSRSPSKQPRDHPVHTSLRNTLDERSVSKPHTASTKRDSSPSKLAAQHKSRSRTRSPIRKARSPRLLDRSSPPSQRSKEKSRLTSPREKSPRQMSGRKRSPWERSPRDNFPRNKTPREEPPWEKSPREKPPREKSPRERSPREKPPREKSPRERSPREKPPRERSPREKPPREKSPSEKYPWEKSPWEKPPREKPPREKSPSEKHPWEKPPQDKSPRVKSPRVSSKGGRSKLAESRLPKESRSKDEAPNVGRKSREEKSPKRNSASLSPIDSGRTRLESNNSVKSIKHSSSDDVSRPLLTAIGSERKESETSLNVSKSSQSSKKPQLKSYVQVVDPTPPIRHVPYLEDDEVISISPHDNTDSLNIHAEKETSNAEGEASQKPRKSKDSKHKASNGDETDGKLKVKRKSKKSQEKKRKKKALAESRSASNVERNTDDELEDLLFTKTDKESKEEDVFKDSEVFTAKHNLRTTIVDLDMKKLKSVDSPVRKDSVVESKKLSSVVVPSNQSSEPYEPENPDFIELEKDFPESENPSVQSGFSTIPFLSTDKQQKFAEVDDIQAVPQIIVESDNAAYSPHNEPYSPPVPLYSPLEEPVSDFGSPKKSSTMNLSDISTKETFVEDTVGIVTTAEKVEDFLGRIEPPGRDITVMDMDVTSPTNGMGPNSDNDDIIERLHKEFVKTQHHEAAIQPGMYVDRQTTPIADIPMMPTLTSPLRAAANDPIVQAYGSSRNYGATMKAKRVKRSKKSKSTKEERPFATEKKDIEDALNRVHRQARVEDEMKHALKVYFKRRDITKEEYKSILRRGVPQVANSDHSIDPERIRSLVKKYVAKYKGARQPRPSQNELYEPPGMQFMFSP